MVTRAVGPGPVPARRSASQQAATDEVVERRSLKVVSDEGALVAAVDAALAAQPDVA